MSTQVSEITTLSELMEKVEEYRVTTSRLRIAHPGIEEIVWEIKSLPPDLVRELAYMFDGCPGHFDSVLSYCITDLEIGYHIHAVSVPVE